ncbi:hypothetical protein M4578_02405 [Salipiger sp. P9]|uniref:hypothetical protein n=1 Tax=Salipiger pentaromativorans TaxID=2943193 RepID=UPI0021582E4E|nr:hypothetical protein [Salipiger pentaromativorans]MCR8546666.1 hypothetical protein [Salipiger pentaromativorans]
MQIVKFLTLGAALAGLSACGDTLGEQALIGAGAGAATAVAVDGDLATGAVVGAAGNIAYCQRYPSRC